MLHKILDVKGVEVLSKNTQKQVKGGEPACPAWVCDSLDAWPLQPACYCE
ncbi:hypothetical protein [Aquimarina sp. 433]